MNLRVLTIELISNFRSNCILNLAQTIQSDPLLVSGECEDFNACVPVSRIIGGVEMTVFWKGSDCPNGKNTCSSPGILTSCLGSEMRILSFCGVITYLLSVISWTSLNRMWILETWSMNCSSTTSNVCVYHLCLET